MLHWLTQLRLAQKFTLLGLVTLAMVAFPSALYLKQTITDVRQAHRQADGVPVLMALNMVIQHTQVHRGLSAGVLSGNEGMQQRRVTAKEAVNQAIAESPGLAKTWWFRSRPYGSGDPYDVYSQVIQYHLRDVASKVVTPLFIADPEGEQFWPEQSEQLASLVSGPVELCRFTAAEGADMHCEPMARKLFQQRAFDWLDQTLGLTS